MKICHTMLCMNAGGAERVVSILSNEWAKKGHDVSIILIVGDEYPIFYDLDKKIKIYKLNLFKESKNIFQAIFQNYKRIKSLRNKIKTINPDIIISHCPREIALTALSTLVFKYPIYGCIHSDLHPLHYKEQSFAWKILEYISFSFIKSCIGLNSDTIKNLPYLAKFRAQVIYNPVLPKDNNFSLPNYEKSKNIIAVGSLTKRKNHELLINAFSKISNEFSNWTLTIFGEGNLKSSLTKQIENLNLTEKVFLRGITNNIKEEFLKSSIFIMPSLAEPWGMSMIEAMSYGLPIITTDCSSIQKILVRDNIDGKIVANNSISNLSSAMRELMANPNLRLKLGRNATEISNRFDFSNTLNQWNKIFHSQKIKN